MSFLFPAFLVGALAVAIPLVLHLLRRDVAPEVPFSAVRLLRRTPLEQTRRHRLRELLLLAARVAALLLLAAAFARPYFADRADAGLHVVAIDRSYSMGASGRFDRALELAGIAIRDTAAGERVAVVAFDDRATVVSPAGGRNEALAALGGLRPGQGATRYAPVVQRAVELADQGRARLTVVTDLQRGGWGNAEAASIPDTLQVEVRDTGASIVENLALTAVRHDGDGFVVSVRNDGAAPRSSQVVVSADGRAIQSATFTSPAGGASDIRVAVPEGGRGELAFDVDDSTGYAADNRRFVFVDAARPRVLIVSDDGVQGGFYLARALQAAEGDQPIDVRTVTASALGRQDGQPLDGLRAVALLSTRALDRRARERIAAFVRAGGGLFVAAAPEVDAAALAGLMGWSTLSAVERGGPPLVLTATDLRHPIFRPFGSLAANLGQARFARSWRIGDDGWDVVARFSDGSAALLERRDGEGRVILFASDVDRRWNDFPLNPAFVPFAVETLRHATPAVDAPREYAVGDVPAGVEPQPGFQTQKGTERRVAVNVDAGEGAPGRMSGDEFTAMLQPVPGAGPAPMLRRAQQAEARQNLWQYGLVLMLGALVAESLVGRSR